MMPDLPLKHIRVADFSWWGAGPIATKMLAAFGAQVIKIESLTHLDNLRRQGTKPVGKEDSLNAASTWNNLNPNKLSITLNLNRPEGIALAKRLIAISDIVCDNFTTHAMEQWGLTYPELTAVNPNVIVCRHAMAGTTGPHRHFTGNGSQLEYLAGLASLTGYGEGRALGANSALPDWGINPTHWVYAMLAALEYRERTGKGQSIDQAQLESTMATFGVNILEYTANGTDGTHRGNHSPYAAPRGVYRCRGEERWCAIEVRNDAEWWALCTVLGNPSWALNEPFCTLRGRLEHQEKLDTFLEDWTSRQTAEEVMWKLQRAGVPASVVANAEDLVYDPQLRARSHYAQLEHPEIGKLSYNVPAIKLSRTPYDMWRAAPLLAQDNEFVYRTLLGLSDEEYQTFASDAVFE